jgi:hypothetical protein
MRTILAVGNNTVGEIYSNINGNTSSQTYSQGWARNSNWLQMPTLASGSQMFVGLMGVTNDSANFVALSATVSSGNYMVDWGDGTVDTVASNSNAYHTYNYATVGNYFTNKASVLMGQCFIKVYPQTANLTSLNLQIQHNQAGLNVPYVVNFLDISLNAPNCTTLTLGGGTILLDLLENVTIGQLNITSTNNLFLQCSALQSVPLFNTVNVTNMQLMFCQCSALQSVPLFNTVNVTNMQQMFYQCFALQSVPLFNTVNVTNMQYMFYQCSALQSVPALNSNGVTSTNFDYIFTTCSSLSSSQISGTHYSISYDYCKLSESGIVNIFNNLGNTTGQSITVTNNFGTSSLTSGDRMIASGKGWTVIG